LTTSYSVTLDESLLVTTKVAGPESSLSLAGSQPASLIATFTVLAAPALATAALVSLSPPSVAASSTTGAATTAQAATMARTRGRTASGARTMAGIGIA
jgi:hypothetical protein